MSKKFIDKINRIRILLDWGVPISKIARKWKVSRQTIYNWLAKADKEYKSSS